MPIERFSLINIFVTGGETYFVVRTHHPSYNAYLLGLSKLDYDTSVFALDAHQWKLFIDFTDREM